MLEENWKSKQGIYIPGKRLRNHKKIYSTALFNYVGLELEINETERSIGCCGKLFNRNPSVSIAYELAEAYLQTNQLDKAKTYADYGVENATEKMGKTFYESQQPYQVPLKAAFMYLQGLIKYNENKTTNADAAAAILEEAIKLAPNFNLARLSKNAILNQKEKPKED